MGPPETLADVLFPARDVSFGRLVEELSEAPTGPHADNLVSNEDSYPRVAGEIGRRAPAGGVYLGVGPDQNFTLIAHARPRLAFVVDYRRRNLLLHLVHKALFALSADRASYLMRLTARRPAPLGNDPGVEELVAAFSDVPLDRELLGRTVAEVADLARPWGVVHDSEWAEVGTTEARLAGPGLQTRFLALRMYPTLARQIRTTDREGKPAHFLASEALYREVRERQVGDRVVPIVGDLAGSKALRRIGEWLRKSRLTVAVVYVSDVEFFLLRARRFDAYVDNLARLPLAEGALIVRTSTREIAHPERVAGDSSTTIVRPVDAFLKEARAGRIRTLDDLFRP